MEKRKRGTVKWFNDAKGFGFITDEKGEAYFVHHSSIITNNNFRTLSDGQEVNFEFTSGPKGFQTTKVWPVERIGGRVTRTGQYGWLFVAGDDGGDYVGNLRLENCGELIAGDRVIFEPVIDSLGTFAVAIKKENK